MKRPSKKSMKPKAPLKWVFMDIITAKSPKSFTSETNFYNYLLIVDAYPKTQNFIECKELLLKKLWIS